jgi:hypothetical protein
MVSNDLFIKLVIATFFIQYDDNSILALPFSGLIFKAILTHSQKVWKSQTDSIFLNNLIT